MLLDDQETNSLKERQAKFLKTKRVKRAYRGNNEHSHEGPTHKEIEDQHVKTPTPKEKPPKEEKQKIVRKPAAEKPPKAP